MADNSGKLLIFASMKHPRLHSATVLALLLITLSASAQHRTQRGKATYYSRKATGARTADGGRLHHDSLTCAHRSLPFGTLLKVTNLRNQKSIVVKVTDRGPYRRGCIIDLSYGAAAQLGMLAQGIAMVEVQRISGTTPPYRLDDSETGMPDFEFDFSKASYSFIKEWNSNTAEKQEKEDQDAAKRKLMAARNTEREKEKTEKEKAGQKQQSNATQHTVATPNKRITPKPKLQTKKQDPSVWSNIFKKVKNWFGD